MENYYPQRSIKISPVDSGRLSLIESKRLFPVNSQLENHPQRRLFLSQIGIQSPTSFIITSNSGSSSTKFISGILSRVSLPYRVILSSIYSPAELSSDRVSSSRIFTGQGENPQHSHHCSPSPTEAEELWFFTAVKNNISPTLQIVVRDLFSHTQIITSAFHVHTS